VRWISDRLFDSSFGYRFLRGAFHFGVRRGPIRKALALQPGDRVLDVGCGTGDYARVVDQPGTSLLGLDLCPAYVEEARRVYGSAQRTFEVGDVRRMDFPPSRFTKAMYLGVMHHLNDEDNLTVLRRLAEITSDRVVIMDLVLGGWHVLNTLLCHLDRGRYPRTVAQQVALVSQVMDVARVGTYLVRSGTQHYSLLVATPRRAGSAGVRAAGGHEGGHAEGEAHLAQQRGLGREDPV
jgi:ubiquinone/menaquinone biosynthesis C-methylase UbiE